MDKTFRQIIRSIYDSIAGAIRVTVTGDLVIGKDYDTLNVTYPTVTTELFTYSLDSVTVKSIRITYTDSAKDNLTTVEVI